MAAPTAAEPEPLTAPASALIDALSVAVTDVLLVLLTALPPVEPSPVPTSVMLAERELLMILVVFDPLPATSPAAAPATETVLIDAFDTALTSVSCVTDSTELESVAEVLPPTVLTLTAAPIPASPPMPMPPARLLIAALFCALTVKLSACAAAFVAAAPPLLMPYSWLASAVM